MQVGRMDSNHSNEQQQYYFKHATAGSAVPLAAAGVGGLYPSNISAPVAPTVSNIQGVTSILTTTPGSPAIILGTPTTIQQQQPQPTPPPPSLNNIVSLGPESTPLIQTSVASVPVSVLQHPQTLANPQSSSISPSSTKKRRQKRGSPVNSTSPKNNFPLHLLNSGDMTAAPTELTLLVQQAMHPPLPDHYVPPPPSSHLPTSYHHSMTSTSSGLSPRGSHNIISTSNSSSVSSSSLTNVSSFPHPSHSVQIQESNKQPTSVPLSISAPVTSAPLVFSSNHDNNVFLNTSTLPSSDNNVNVFLNTCTLPSSDSISSCAIDSRVTHPTVINASSAIPALPLININNVNSDKELHNPPTDSTVLHLSNPSCNVLNTIITTKDSKPPSETRSSETPNLESDTNDSTNPAYAISGSDIVDDDGSKDIFFQVRTPSSNPSPAPSLAQSKMDVEKLESTFELVLDMARSDEPHEKIFVLPPRTRESPQRITPMGPPDTPGPSISPRQPASPSPRQQQPPSNSPVLSSASPQPLPFSPSTSLHSITVPQSAMQQQSRPTISHTQPRIQQQPFITPSGTTSYFVEQGPPTGGIAPNQRQVITQQKQTTTTSQVQANTQISTFQPTVFIQQQPASADGTNQGSVAISPQQHIHYTAHPVQTHSVIQQQQPQQIQPQQHLFMHHTAPGQIQTTQIIGQRQVFPVVQQQTQSHAFLNAAQLGQNQYTAVQSPAFSPRHQVQTIQKPPQVISTARFAVHKPVVAEAQNDSNIEKATPVHGFIQQHTPSNIVTITQQNIIQSHSQQPQIQQLTSHPTTIVQSGAFSTQQFTASITPVSTAPTNLPEPVATQALPASQSVNKFNSPLSTNIPVTNSAKLSEVQSSPLGVVVPPSPSATPGQQALAASSNSKKRPNPGTKGASTKRRKTTPAITQAEQKKITDGQKMFDSMVEKLKVPSLTALIHQPKICSFNVVLPPNGSTYDAKFNWNNALEETDWLEGKTFKYKQCPFALKFPKPDTSFIESDNGNVSLSDKDIERIAPSENKFMAQHLATNIPDGPMLHGSLNKSIISDTDPPLSPVCASPAPQTLENQVVLLMSNDKRPEPSPGIPLESSGPPMLHMFYPSNCGDGQCDRSSPPLAMFHLPNPQLLQKLSASSVSQPKPPSANDSQQSTSQTLAAEVTPTNPSMTSCPASTELTVSTGHSTVQLTINGAHSGSMAYSQGGAGSSPLVDSETGEVLGVRSSTSAEAAPDVHQENGGSGSDLSKEKIHLTFTLSPKSPDNVQKMVKNISDILGINYNSVNYQVTRTDLNTELTMDPKSSVGPQRFQELEQKLRDQIAPLSLRLQKDDASLDQGVLTPTAMPTPTNCLTGRPNFLAPLTSPITLLAKHEEEPVSVSVLKAFKKEDSFCKHCEMFVQPNTGVTKKLSEQQTDLGFSLKSDPDIDELTFCSPICATQFIQCIADTDLAIQRAKDDSFLTPGINTVGGANSSGVSKESSHVIEYRQQFFNVPVVLQGPPPRNPKAFPRRQFSQTNDRNRKKTDLKSSKRWHGIRWKNYSPLASNPTKKRVALTEAEVIELLQKKSGALRLSSVTDQRMCALCHVKGDAAEDGPGRLLCLDIDKWLHINCALWCFDIYETLGGSLNSVDACYRRAIMTMCSYCGLYGAGLPCYNPRCSVVYHLPCAQAAGCMFFTDRGMYCQLHQPKEHHMHLKSLSVNRRVYITRDENKQVARVIHEEDQKHIVRIGSLMLHSVGQLLPHQIDRGTFHTRRYIFPVGFTTTRIYWSMRRPQQRCSYRCSIRDSDGKPEFVVTAIEEGLPDEVIVDESCEQLWKTILERIERIRIDNSLVKMFPKHLQAEELFGLTEPHIVRAIESLPGVEALQDYAFKFGRLQLIAEMPLAINPSGTARSEPKMRTYFRRPRFVHAGSSTSRTFLPLRMAGPGDEQTPYSKQYSSSRSQQYRKLKAESRNNVILGRSRIQGLGLYAARDLEKYTMIIEYIGQLIRAELANKREKEYDEHNRGTYMFRLDDNMILDATLSGGLARYVNHSCQPNCVAEVVSFEKESHIIIFANKRIERGEELTYDYKFDFEDSGNKIPCLCGAPMCRKWMN